MLYDPQFTLQKAVYKRLIEIPIVINGIQVKSYEFVPSGVQAPYILISQQTVTPTNGSQSCKMWECTLLLDIVTSFAVNNQVSSLLSSQIAEVVLSRFVGQRLPLGDNFGMSPAELIMSQTLTDNPTQETVDIHRYLRMRFVVEFHK